MRLASSRVHERRRLPVVAAACSLLCGGLVPAPAPAQQSVTMEQAVGMALSRGPTLLMARADSASAVALVSQARAIPNPTATAQYTKSTPQHHFEVEQPLVYPWVRSAEVGAATRGRDAAVLRLELARATVTHDVEVAYLTAAAAEGRRDLSAQTARDALELVQIASRRLEAGDAAELEVALARVAAGAAVNRAASDSAEAITALLDLQRLMGEPVGRVTVTLADSLGMTMAAASPSSAPDEPMPLGVAAARADVEAGEAALAFARRSRLPTPSLVAGFESHDPSGGEPGTLPLFGIALSVPLFNQRGGEVDQARAELDRARGALSFAQRESAAAVATARIRHDAARTRVGRDRTVLDDAERVASLSSRAYEEGAFPLSSVLEAQRSAREARLQFVEDVLAARIAQADYELATVRGRQP